MFGQEVKRTAIILEKSNDSSHYPSMKDERNLCPRDEPFVLISNKPWVTEAENKKGVTTWNTIIENPSKLPQAALVLVAQNYPQFLRDFKFHLPLMKQAPEKREREEEPGETDPRKDLKM